MCVCVCVHAADLYCDTYLQPSTSQSTCLICIIQALCLASPAPASFHVLVGIRSCHPSSSFADAVMVHRRAPPSPLALETQRDSAADNTLQDSLERGTHPPAAPPAPAAATYTYTYMFSVCIFDDTACCDAIVYAREGERLLAGVTAEQLHHTPALQQSCRNKLERAIAEGATFEFEIVTYLTTSQPSPDNNNNNLERESETNSSSVVAEIDAASQSTPQAAAAKRGGSDLNVLEEQDPDRLVFCLLCSN
jgi:hypothetical protein